MANATGCSMIWSSTAGTSPYNVNHFGQGPAWGNSLFEDNAEYGYGIFMAGLNRRKDLKNYVTQNINNITDSNVKVIMNNWLDNFENADECDLILKMLKTMEYSNDS
jgi:pyruvate-ferredoxin/flavodoxin oxidoreductase